MTTTTNDCLRIENYFLFALKNKDGLNTPEYEEILQLLGMQHFSDIINMSNLKIEFMNIHSFFDVELLAGLKCFHDIFKFFKRISTSNYNRKVLSSNIWKLF